MGARWLAVFDMADEDSLAGSTYAQLLCSSPTKLCVCFEVSSKPKATPTKPDHPKTHRLTESPGICFVCWH